jgi:hypothetical protein
LAAKDAEFKFGVEGQTDCQGGGRIDGSESRAGGIETNLIVPSPGFKKEAELGEGHFDVAG